MWAGKMWAQCKFVRVSRGRQTPPDLYWKAEFGFGEILAFYFPKTSYNLFGKHLKGATSEIHVHRIPVWWERRPPDS